MKRQTTIGRPLTDKRLEQILGLYIAEGLIEVYGLNEQGEPLYKNTPAGTARAERIIAEIVDDGPT